MLTGSKLNNKLPRKPDFSGHATILSLRDKRQRVSASAALEPPTTCLATKRTDKHF